jgi:hypothetical protein
MLRMLPLLPTLKTDAKLPTLRREAALAMLRALAQLKTDNRLWALRMLVPDDVARARPRGKIGVCSCQRLAVSAIAAVPIPTPATAADFPTFKDNLNGTALVARSRGERLPLFSEQNGQQLCRPGGAGISRDRVQLPGSLQEHLTGGISPFRLVADLRSNLAFEDVRDRDARMPMGGRALAGSVRDFHRRGRPALQRQIGHIMLEHDLGAGWGALSLQEGREKQAGCASK